jgi:translocator protein
MDPFTWIGWIVWFIVTYIQIYDPIVTVQSEWYNNNIKNVTFAPPKFVYPIAWFIIYALMSVAISLFWQDPTIQTFSTYNAVIILYLVDVILNKLWTVIFFQLRMPAFAFVEIIFLILCTIAVFVLFIIDGAVISAVFFGIYLLWLLFAAALNLSFWFTTSRNKQLAMKQLRIQPNKPQYYYEQNIQPVVESKSVILQDRTSEITDRYPSYKPYGNSINKKTLLF